MRLKNPNAKPLWRQYRKSALKRGLTWEVPFETFMQITGEPCYLCGIESSNSYVHDSRKPSSKNNPFVYNGIDRVVNSAGYVHGNLMSCCGTCNMAKKSMDIESFLSYIARVYSYNFGTGCDDGQ